MVSSVVASLALFGAVATAFSTGGATVVNMCSYDVYLCNVPASGGGYAESDKTLSSGETWNQGWTELTNGDGWSIKLSKTDNLNDILQYEYTFHNDGTIWYDLSCVNGNPWDGNWEITSSTATCSPKQQAYRYATDDAYGMQSCPQDASITVTLCSGEATDNGTYPISSPEPASSSSPAPVYSAPTSSSSKASVPASSASASSTVEASAPAHTTIPASPSYSYNWNNNDVSSSLAPETPSAVVTPTTFATQVTQVAMSANGQEVTEVETVFVTDVVTAYAKPRARRHNHQHAHQRNA